MIRSGAMVLAAALASACAAIHHTPPADQAELRPSNRVPVPTDAVFSYRPAPIDFDNHLVRTGPNYRVRRVSFPSIGDNAQPDNLVTVDYHQSSVAGRHPAVVVLPIWGRHLYPSAKITKALRQRSGGRLHVLNVLGPEFLVDWPALGTITDEDEFVATWIEGAEREINTVIDIRRLIDWAETRPEIDADRMGLVGFSHGAIIGPTIAAQEPRITALVAVMGGALPHMVVARCEGSRTATIQERAFNEFGWTRDELEARLEPIFAPIDPANHSGRVDPDRVLIFEAGRDQCVPEAARDALWRAMGRPERYTIMSNHRRAFYSMTPLRANWMRTKIWRFFERVLLEGDAGSETSHREATSTSR